MDSKSASKKPSSVTEQGAVIKFSMPAGPESDEFYSNLVRKFGQDAVSRTVKENCPAMSPRSKSPTSESVCSLTKIEAVNDNFHQQLTATLKQDIDWNFIDFVIDYLLSSDKDGQQAADVDKLIQNYVKLNPQLREQLVDMLKHLAEAKEVKAEEEVAVIPKKSTKVKSDNVTLHTPNFPHSLRSPTRYSPNISSDVTKTLSSDVAQTERLSAGSEGILRPESRTMQVASKLKVSPQTTPNVREPSPLQGPSRTRPLPSVPSETSPSSSPGSPPRHVNYVRIVGATPKAYQLLRVGKHCLDNVTVIHTAPQRTDDSDYDEVFHFGGCNYEELVDFGSISLSPSKKKKKKNRKKNKKKRESNAMDTSVEAGNSAAAQDSLTLADLENATDSPGVSRALGPDYNAPQTPTHDADVDEDDDEDEDDDPLDLPPRFSLDERAPSYQELSPIVVEPCGHEMLGSNDGLSRDVLAITKPLRLAKHSLARYDIQLDREFCFDTVPLDDDGVVQSWDDLRGLVAELFPNDFELQAAFANQAHDSLDLWKFIVKYGKLYKDFVSEVLETVNELKKGLIDAMDVHRGKTNEILETHKTEMCTVLEKARHADERIHELEKEIASLRRSADVQKLEAITSAEKMQDLQKDLTAKNKKIKEFESVRSELSASRRKAAEDQKVLTEVNESLKKKLSDSKSQCDSLRSKMLRWKENAEESEYKMRDLENKVSDDRVETDKLRDRNQTLTKKVDNLQSEIAKLKEKLAKHKKVEVAVKATSTSPLKLPSTVPMKPVHSTACCSSPISRNAYNASLSNQSPTNVVPPTNSRILRPSNPALFQPPLANAIGSIQPRGFPSGFQNDRVSRSSPFSSADSRERPRPTYAAASAGISRSPSFTGNSRFRDSPVVSNPNPDTEVHALLTPNETSLTGRNDFLTSAGLGSCNLYSDIRDTFSSSYSDLQSSNQENFSATSSQLFASRLMDNQLSYNPWGGPSTFDYSQQSLSTLFDIKPRSSSNNDSTSSDAYSSCPGSPFLNPNPSVSSSLGFADLNQNAVKRNLGYTDCDHRRFGS